MNTQVSLPVLPRSDSNEAADAIEGVMAQRHYPTSPQAAARAGFEACRQLANQQRTMTALAQVLVVESEGQITKGMAEQVRFWSTEHAKARSAEMAMRADVDRLLGERRRALALLERIDKALADGCSAAAVRAMISKAMNPLHTAIFPFIEGSDQPQPVDQTQPHLVREDNRDLTLEQHGQQLASLPAGTPMWQAVLSAVGQGFIPPRETGE